MKGEGAHNADIAMAVGLTEGSVRSLCHQRGIRRPTSGRLDLAIGARLIEACRAEATRRDMRFERFMRLVIFTIVQDNLFSAIIDDEKQ